MSRLAFHLPRLLALALAIAAAMTAYWLQSVRATPPPTPPAAAAVEPDGARPCNPPVQGFTTYTAGRHTAAQAGACAKPHRTAQATPSPAGVVRRERRPRHRLHPFAGS